MHLTYHSPLRKQTLGAPDYAETSMSFHGGDGDREGDVAAEVQEILTLAFVCFEVWLKPLFSQPGRHNLSPIHEYDPYVAGLTRYLQGQRRSWT